MIQPGWGGVLLAVVLSSFGAGVWKGCDLERDRWEDRLSSVQDSLRDSRSDAERLRLDSAVLSSRYRVDTVRVPQLVDRWHRQDTAWLASVPDTVRVEVEKTIHLADSTIEACTVAWRGCEALRANAEDRAAQYQKQIDGLTRQLAKPPPLWKRPGVTLPFGLGLGIAGVLLLR
jgi:hypothetical protein